MTSLRLRDRMDETLARVESLSPESPRSWGKLDPPGMLVHCQRPLEVAAGERPMKRSLIGKLLGGFARKKFIDGDGPFGKNSPTDPDFITANPGEFAEERERLVQLIRDYGAHGPRTTAPHPFFGPLTEDQWDRLMWKHLDHHLRQFGA